jgi:hypothetical protein
MHKAWYWIGGIVAAGFIYNIDAYIGQWKFEKLCKEEGGPRYFEPVEKDVGWEVLGNEESDYKVPFAFKHVKFVRWKNKEGVSFDVYVDEEIRKLPYPRRSEYVLKEANFDEPVAYRYLSESIKFPDDHRFSRYKKSIINTKTNKNSATYTEFGYAWTTPDRVILAAPTRVNCWAGETEESE